MSSENDYKERIRNAMAKNYERQLKKEKGPQRRNEKPEKEVEKACVELMRSWGWSVEIYEAKATYDPKLNRYRQQSMKQGTLDCMGVTNEGIAVAVEFKAPGKLATLRDGQRLFLFSRIHQYAFACVVDSKDRLTEIHKKWDFLRHTGNIEASRDYLLSVVPKQKVQGDQNDPLFPDQD